MKKTMIFAAMMTFGLLAHAETVTVSVKTATAVLPAGDYTISTVPGSTSVLMVETAGKKTFKFGRLVKAVDSGKVTLELTGTAPKAPVVTAGLIKCHGRSDQVRTNGTRWWPDSPGHWRVLCF